MGYNVLGQISHPGFEFDLAPLVAMTVAHNVVGGWRRPTRDL